MRRIISVTSGKGGVGKTLTSISLAIAARANGLSTLIVDGDLGLSNVDVLLGLQPSRSLADVLDGACTINDIILKGPRGIDIIPSGSGIARMADLGPLERSCIISELSRIKDNYDVIFVDTGAGISPSVLSLNAASDAMVVVTTPEPHSLTDAYATIKVMSEEFDRGKCFLIVNQVRSDDEGSRIGQRISDVAHQFMNVRVTPIGSVRSDSVLQKSIMARKVSWDGALNTLASQGWSSAWRRLYELLQNESNSPNDNDLSRVWQALAGSSNHVSNL